MAISYTKLRSGDWGVRSTEAIHDGQVVTVTKKDGATKRETINKIVWVGNGVWLASLQRAQQPARGQRRDPDAPGRNGMMRGCGDCRSLGRMCEQCKFDEYDM
jgi:hypothetical protein